MAKSKNTLKYYLTDNPLTPDPVDCKAVPMVERTRTQDDLVEEVLDRENGLSKAEILGVMTEYHKAILRFLEDGDSVITDFCSIRPRIRGVFKDQRDGFDRSRHEVYFRISPYNGMSEVARKIEVEKIAAKKTVPWLDTLLDLHSDTANERLTPQRSVKLYGENLKFDPTDPQQGIFLIDQKKKEVQVTSIIEITPKKLFFNNPDTLPAGTYQVEVRTGLISKELRKGTLYDLLTVG